MSDYEQVTGHRKERHGEDCELASCSVCELFICAICGGSEGSLLPTCPGRRLTFDEDQANYQHYIDGTGPFTGSAR